MANRHLVVVGASAGGVEALRTLVSRLPADLPATVLVVLHVPEQGRSHLPAILSRAGVLPARHAVEGEPLRPGEILVAPPNHHLVVVDGSVRITHGPRENGHRPAVDPLFRTAARWHGPRVTGVVLSGTLDDGTAGQVAVAQAGGVTVVQDPDDALYSGMPLSVIEHVAVDHVVPAVELGPLLGRVSREQVDMLAAPEPSPQLRKEAEIVHLEVSASPDPPGDPAGLGCPQCGGSLFAIDDKVLVRYRCRVGHAWSPESLLAEQSEALESALWMALRTLEDRAALCRRTGQSALERGHHTSAARFRSQAAEAEDAAKVMRGALERAERATRETVAATDQEAAGPRPVAGG